MSADVRRRKGGCPSRQGGPGQREPRRVVAADWFDAEPVQGLAPRDADPVRRVRAAGCRRGLRPGRGVIVRDRDYHVESFENGRMSAGPSHAYRPIPAGPVERVDFVRQFAMSSPIGGRDGGLGHAPAELLTDESVARLTRTSTFAETLPLFRSGDIHLDVEGRLWVGRSARAGEVRLYDVLDAAGRSLARIRLRPDRQLLTVGRHAWTVYTDGDGLQTIERYAIPQLSN